MDPITLIVTALVTGAAAGVTDTASSAIKDAYAGLKAMVRKRLAGRADGLRVLDRHEKAPDIWQAPLKEELDQAGAAHDASLVAAAEALMRLIDEAGGQRSKYTVDTHGAQGVQVGDGNTQHNVFGVPPGGLAPADTGGAGRPGQRPGDSR